MFVTRASRCRTSPRKLTIKTGKNAGSPPSVASLYRALAEAEQAAEVRRRAAAGEKKTAPAREYKISRETLYGYLRPAAVTG